MSRVFAVVIAVVFAALFATSAAAQDARSPTTFSGNLGYVSATGNTKLATLSVGEALGHSVRRWAFSQLAAYVYGETDDQESAIQLRLAARADFAFQPRFGVFGGVSFERNRYAGFARRTEFIAGLRWKAIVASADSMGLDAGSVLTRQADVDGSSDTYASARAALAYKHVFSKAAYFQQLAEYVPNLQQSGAYRLNAESVVVAPISTHVGIKINYAVRFNSRPPVSFGSTDRVLTMGVQLSY